MYMIGKNMPGYLPESEPYAADTLADAFAVMADDIRHDWDGHAEAHPMENDCPTCAEYAEALGYAEACAEDLADPESAPPCRHDRGPRAGARHPVRGSLRLLGDRGRGRRVIVASERYGNHNTEGTE